MSLHNNRYVYSSDESGVLKQIEVDTHKLIKSYSSLHRDSVEVIFASVNNLFTSDKLGNLSMFCIDEDIVRDLVNDEEQKFEQSIGEVLALIKSGYFPIIIRKTHRNKYLKALQSADINRYIPLMRFAINKTKETYRKFFETYYQHL